MRGGKKPGFGSRGWRLGWRRLGWLVLLTSGCGAAWQSSPAPALTQADATRLSQHGQPTTVAELGEGRTLFVSRCASCHALPRPDSYGPEKWATFIDEMAARAKLGPVEARAVLHYLLAARDMMSFPR